MQTHVIRDEKKKFQPMKLRVSGEKLKVSSDETFSTWHIKRQKREFFRIYTK